MLRLIVHQTNALATPISIEYLTAAFLKIFFADIPVILTPGENIVITVDQSTSTMFNCSATGTPPPTISWVRVYANGTTEELSGGRYVLLDPVQDDQYISENTGTVRVSRVNHTLDLLTTFDSDSGTYRCIASNVAGHRAQDFELVVQGM